jgi:iron complex transport system substrate-binding protein
MRTRVSILLALVVAAALVPAGASAQADSDCEFPVEVTDATGTEVEVVEEPQRVVTLNPSAAQTMWEIGAWDKVVGATKHAANLEGFADVENISATGETISSEIVVGLDPDLAIAPNVVEPDTVEALREAGVTVYHFREATSISDVKDKTRLVGRLVGACEGAADTVAWMDERLAVVDEATAGPERPSAMYVFFGYTAGQDTFIDEMIRRSGADNLAADVGIQGYKPVNEEILVNNTVDWLILNTDWTEVPRSAAYNSTRAVQQNRIVVVNTDYLNRPGPRVVYAIETMVEAFHPEAYDAANRTQTPGATDTPDEATPTPQAPATTRGGEGPGFGVVLAAVALMLLGLHRRP